MVEAFLERWSRRGSPAAWALLAALVLAVFGMVIQWSVTTVYGDQPYGRVLRQGGALLLAAVVCGCCVLVGHRRLLAMVRPLLVLTWALLVLVLFMPSAGGSHRWLVLGPLHFQPSELAKVVMILYLAELAAGRGERIRSFREGFLPAFTVLGLTVGMILLEPDLGQALFVLALGSVVLLVSGLRTLHFAKMLGLVAPGVLLLMLSSFEYVQARLDSFFAGFDPSTQVGQGLMALAAGGVTGMGPGNGRAHLHYVPEIHNDFVLAAVGEQFGFLGCTVLLALFAVLFLNGVRVAFRARTCQGAAVAYGVSFMIALQAAVNVAVVTGTVPPKGISLPFVSLGGSSLLVLGCSLGLLVSVDRETTSAGEAETKRSHRRRAAGPAGATALKERSGAGQSLLDETDTARNSIDTPKPLHSTLLRNASRYRVLRGAWWRRGDGAPAETAP